MFQQCRGLQIESRKCRISEIRATRSWSDPQKPIRHRFRYMARLSYSGQVKEERESDEAFSFSSHSSQNPADPQRLIIRSDRLVP